MPDEDRRDDPYGYIFGEVDHRLQRNERAGGALGGDGRYPGADPARPGECASCGDQLPPEASERFCQSCLRHRADRHTDTVGGGYRPDADARSMDPASTSGADWDLQQVQFALVAGRSKFLAAAKGAAAVDRAADATDGVDLARPVYSFSTGVPGFIEQRWGGRLPRITPLAGTTAQRIVRIAREDLADDRGDTPTDLGAIPRFVGATGDPIDVDADLASAAREHDPLLEGAPAEDDQSVWLLPAWTLGRTLPQKRHEFSVTWWCPRCESYSAYTYHGTIAPPTPDHRPFGVFECPRCSRHTLGPPGEEARKCAESDTKPIGMTLASEPPKSLQRWARDQDVIAGPFSPPDVDTEGGD